MSTDDIASTPDLEDYQDDYQASVLRLKIEKERTEQKKLELMKTYTGKAIFHNVVTTNTTMEFGASREKL